MKFTECIADLREQEQAIKDKFESLKNGIEHGEWVFYIDTDYVEPRAYAWKQCGFMGVGVTFIIVKEGGIKMLSAGIYGDAWQEVESILNDWLSQDFSEEVWDKCG